MTMTKELFSILLTAILTQNFVLAKFLGICPFLGVSKKLNTAVGMSAAVIFVMGLATAVTYPINKFLLGYAPNKKREFTHNAQRKGYKKEHMVEVGLTIERENGELVDRYYDRVIFPIRGISGKVIAFGGRKLRNDKEVAKYINSPESEVYVKNKVLYGIYEAKQAIAKAQKCYLVEGYTDVISFHQAGVENVVASSGTSLTTGQIQLIKRFTNNVTVLYDGDWAGIKASLRGIDMLLEEGLEIKVALFPDGEDPDSFARKHTREELLDFLTNNEEDFISFKQRLLAQELNKDPLQRAKLIGEVVNSIAVIPDAIVRTVYIEQTASKLNIKEELLQQVALWPCVRFGRF